MRLIPCVSSTHEILLLLSTVAAGDVLFVRGPRIEPKARGPSVEACHLTNDRCVLPTGRTGLHDKHAAGRERIERSTGETVYREAVKEEENPPRNGPYGTW